MKNLTQFRIGIVMLIIESLIFTMSAVGGRFNSMVFLTMIFWALWIIYFSNQRGKKCELRIIPVEKSIEIGDLVMDESILLFNNKISVCLVSGGLDYSQSAYPVQLVIVDGEDLKVGDTCLNIKSKELKQYNGEKLDDDDLAVLLKEIELLHLKKVILFQKDLSQKFIQTVIDGETKDEDTVMVRKNHVSKERPFYKDNLFFGFVFVFFGCLLGNIVFTIYDFFPKENIIGHVITLMIGIAVISPFFYHAIKFIKYYFKGKKENEK